MYKVCEYVFCLPSNWQYDAERGEGERELERYGCSEKYVGVCFFMYTVFQVHVHVHVHAKYYTWKWYGHPTYM